MTLYLKGHQKYDRSKLKVQLLLSKFRLFNFDLSYLLYPLRYRVTQYLIGNSKQEHKKLSCGSTSSICQDIFNSDNLLYKRGFVKTQSLHTVIPNLLKQNILVSFQAEIQRSKRSDPFEQQQLVFQHPNQLRRNDEIRPSWKPLHDDTRGVQIEKEYVHNGLILF